MLGASGNTKLPIQDPIHLLKMQKYIVSDCSLSGTLPEVVKKRAEVPDTSQTTERIWDLSRNKLSGPIPASWYNYTWTSFDISGNPAINGAFPKGMFGYGRFGDQFQKATSFDFSNTSLHGPMTLDLLGQYSPSWLSRISKVSMQYLPYIDFCDEIIPFVPWNTPAVTFTCDLKGTTAFNCPQRYNACTLSPPVIPPSTPGAPPSQQPTQNSPTSAATAYASAPGLVLLLFSLILAIWTECILKESCLLLSTSRCVPPNSLNLVFHSQL